ncbi:MAG TPA: ATP-binding protein [Polyangia bacterium]|jgi:signal transduction histidine kinase|nr:ATP-binding protein [Polyangia bacterium]
MKNRRGDGDGTPERDRDRETLRDISPVVGTGVPDAQARSQTPLAGTPAAYSKPGRSNPNMRASGLYRLSGIFLPVRAQASASSFTALAPMRRRGLRRRISAILIVATLSPVIAVSAVAIALIFSSVEQGIAFEAIRGLQVARGLFLQQVQTVARRAANVSVDPPLLHAMGGKPGDVRDRLAQLSDAGVPVQLEVTDAVGRVMARCSQGVCSDVAAEAAKSRGVPVARSPLVVRALSYERTVSIESLGDRLVVRAAQPLVDPALRILGVAVVSLSVDGPMTDRLKASLGAGRELVIYRDVEPSASTFMASTGARLPPPAVPPEVLTKDLSTLVPVVPLEIGGHSYSVAFGQLQDVNAQRVGLLGVAIDREPLAAARRRASTTLFLGALLALLLAIGLGDQLARRLTKPLQNLHAGALSVARGDLDTQIAVDSDDEIGDVAEAFRVMTRSLKENQEGLAARVRELVTVHQVGRAISSVVDLDRVLRSVVSEALSVLHGKTAALALSIDGPKKKFVVRAVAGETVGRLLAPVADVVAALGHPRRTPSVGADPQLMDVAKAAGLTGPLIAAPLALKERIVGVLMVGRLHDDPFAEADLRLLVTFADQTATAIENARLYAEVRAFSENLEQKVRDRTAQLEKAKAEIERTLQELGTAQGHLIHSERMAGLGMLVAGIAHEVNSPAAAVQGLVDALSATVRRLGQCAADLFRLGLPPESVQAYFAIIDGLLPEMETAPLSSTLESRQRLRRMKVVLEHVPGSDAAAAMLAELGEMGEGLTGRLVELADGRDLAPLAGYLREIAFLARTSGTIRSAIGAIRRIVGALKRYSRLDEAPLERVDVHAGLEDTLVILQHQLKSGENGINVKRSYGKIPHISAYVGELNQVWTNLIHNAVQAMGGSGTLVIETTVEDGDVQVAIQDSGPGIPDDVASRIFEPFFTTKGKGEGTGLGLAIASRIVEKHGGRIRVTSEPGRTRFEVRLPIEGPLATPAPLMYALTTPPLGLLPTAKSSGGEKI